MVSTMQQLMAAALAQVGVDGQNSFAALRECNSQIQRRDRFPFARTGAGHQNHLRRTFRLREHKRGTNRAI